MSKIFQQVFNNFWTYFSYQLPPLKVAYPFCRTFIGSAHTCDTLPSLCEVRTYPLLLLGHRNNLEAVSGFIVF